MEEDSTYWQNQAKRLEGQVRILDAQTDVLEKRIEELIAEKQNLEYVVKSLQSQVNYFEGRERLTSEEIDRLESLLLAQGERE